MTEDATHARLLPGTGGDDQSRLLAANGNDPMSRLADRIEGVQLGLAGRLLGRARDLLATGPVGGAEPEALNVQLADALADILRVAESRRLRSGWVGCVPAYLPPGLRAYSMVTLPGRDLASARAARRHVRDTVRLWGVRPETVDDLTLITGELVANALTHSSSRSIAVSCTLTAGTVTVGVTDEGRGDGSAAVPPGVPGAEQERGRGLLITDALATRWGTRRTGDSLTVWAEVAAGRICDGEKDVEPELA